jgi:hypothetical protein
MRQTRKPRDAQKAQNSKSTLAASIQLFFPLAKPSLVTFCVRCRPFAETHEASQTLNSQSLYGFGDLAQVGRSPALRPQIEVVQGLAPCFRPALRRFAVHGDLP